jgi:hypothetical protein
MAGMLTRRPDGIFEGPIGKTVRVDVRSKDPVRTVEIFYAGEVDGEAPFEFEIKSGRHKLLVVALGSDSDQKVNVVEIANDEEHHLRFFFWSTSHFSTTLTIEGVA